MSRIARDLARRLTAAGVDASVIAALVSDVGAARAEAINREGLQAQIAHLLEAYGPAEIEQLVSGKRPGEEQR
jgi:hypothetical protein